MSNALLPSSITSAEELFLWSTMRHVPVLLSPVNFVDCLLRCLFKCMKKHLNLFVIFRQTFCSNLY